MQRLIIAIFFFIHLFFGNAAQIGEWRAYMSYHDITDVQKGGNNLYVLASDNLYYYNTNDNSIYTFDKANGLNDCNIMYISWCQAARKLVIIYENGNIDLLNHKDEIENIPDYKNKNITGDKTINSINIDGQFAYLSTGFGVVKINIGNGEICNTYNLGFSVNYTYIENNTIYAASEARGIYSAALSSNLLDPNSWKYALSYSKRNHSIVPELLEAVQNLQPGGPKYNYMGFTKFCNNALYTCNGSFLNQKGCIQVLKGGEWTIFQDEGIKEQTNLSYIDIATLDVDPNDENHLFAGTVNGLYEFYNGEFKRFYNSDNSPIEAYNGKSKNHQLVTGVLFDNESNLWILNSQAPTKSVIELTKDGKFITFDFPDLIKEYDTGIAIKVKSLGNMVDMMIDSRGLVWFVNNYWNFPALCCLNLSTKEVKCITEFTNQDGKGVFLTQGVRCVTEDKKGNIWIGTDTGPLVLSANDITSDNPEFIQVKVPRNDGTNFADYLLAGVDVSGIVVDGAGRKWFGTDRNGVYLISEDNFTQIEHFTVDNSPLLSNQIMSLSIDNTTGEVFFGTDKGLCSYMSNATQPHEEMTKDNVYAYPNPVTPDYTGNITITGLSYNADVKIVTVNGTLVASGISNGGIFQWDGNDINGNKVASGIYNVVTAKEDGSKGAVCKVAIVR